MKIISKIFFPSVFVVFVGILSINVWAQEANRIYYEDCEDTTYTEHFLEKHYGTAYQSYWAEFTSEVSRSDENPHSGQYCMTYDPWTTGNPHAVVGYAGAVYGNTSHFDLSSYDQRYWYFRWYQRWETEINWSGSAENKLLYINYSNSGDFVFTLKRNDSSNFHITIKDHDTYSIVVNDWLTNPDGNLDDMQWHKLELFIDVGTTGQHNGSYWFKVDDALVKEQTDIQYNGTIHSNPIQHLTGWPSNTSGTPTGTSNTWLDDLEIWDGVPGITGLTAPAHSNLDKSSLQQNYPNPFNPSTTIKYFLTKPSNVQIKIYNQLGQEVYVLVNEQKLAGEYNVTWNGKDAKGNELASGVYYYRLTAGKRVETKQMLYLQ